MNYDLTICITVNAKEQPLAVNLRVKGQTLEAELKANNKVNENMPK